MLFFYLRECFVLGRAAVFWFCLPCDRFLSHARHCRRSFCCCGCVQRYNRGMVDGSAQRGALLACSCICRERGFVRWWLDNKCVVCAGRGWKMFIVACVLIVCACCSVAVLFALRPLPLSRAPLQVVSLLLQMLWMCTTVQRGHGRRLSSALRAIGLQLHPLGTWLCSLGVSQLVRCCAGRGEGGSVDGCVRVGCLRVLQCFCSVCPATACSLMPANCR